MWSKFVTRTHLRRALNLSTTSQDNHLRALVLSLIASHYLHTSNQHAKKMLGTAENLAAGLGTQPRPSKAHAPPTQAAATTVAVADTVGNAHLRLWIGERFLGMLKSSTYLFPCWLFLNLIELYNRTGDKELKPPSSSNMTSVCIQWPWLASRSAHGSSFWNSCDQDVILRQHSPHPNQHDMKLVLLCEK